MLRDSTQRWPALLLLGTLLCLAVTRSWAESTQYQLVDLGTLGGEREQIFARDLNDTGAVVGDARTARGHVAFIWLPARGMHEIGIRSGGHYSATAEAVNRHLAVAGASGFSEIRAPAHAFYWTPDGGMTRLDRAAAGAGFSRATGINGHGQVVGVLGMAGADSAFLWSADTGLRLPLRDTAAVEASRAEAINDRGQMAGTLVRDGAHHAFRWDSETGLTTLDPDSRGFHVNDHGHVAGRLDRDGESVAVIWGADGHPRELGLLDPDRPYSAATAINNAGIVVGRALTEGGFRAFVWTPERGMRQLDRHLAPHGGEPVTLYGAVAVNERGVIAAFGRRRGSDRSRSFLLHPLTGPDDSRAQEARSPAQPRRLP
jgi:probable HAF family extracellular repeat protein